MMKKKYVTLCSLAVVLCVMSPAGADVFTAGGGRLTTMQNKDGGWDWPLSDGSPNIGSVYHIVAPTGMGLAQAYLASADPAHLAALKKAGAYLMAKDPLMVVPEDGYFAVALDGILGGTKYTDSLKNTFYTPLAKGTYAYWGEWAVRVNTDWYVQNLRQRRASDGLPNLAAFDCGIGLYAAHLAGADTKPWITGTKAASGELRMGRGYDVLGLAGAVLGLASVGPNPDVKSADLANLAKTLARYQLTTGGFTWNSLALAEGMGNESVQETAFAILALKECDRSLYLDQITKAAAYLKKVQLATGGWENFSKDGECNEVTGEALWGIAAAEQAAADEAAEKAAAQEQPAEDGSAAPTL